MSVDGRLFVIGLVIALSTDVSRGECDDVPPVNSDLLVKPLLDVFNLTRSPEDIANKQTVRRYIVDAFRNASSLASSLVNKSFVEEQQFDGGNDRDGVNIIYVIRSDKWGSSDDKVLVVGANYDTGNPETPGADDNGSGMAALLETVRLISSLAATCSSNTTLIFVAFDIHYTSGPSESGYVAFASEYLIARVLRKYAIHPDHFRGVLTFKSLMNYDVTRDSQDIPTALFMIASEHANEITLNGNRGNFLAAVSLSNVVYGRLSKSFREHWTQLSGQLASALKPKLYNFELPARLALAVGYKDVIADFSNAGMISFLERLDNYTGGHFNMVILTDTANLRGYMKKCDLHLCDDLTAALKPNNIEFLRITTTSIVHYLALEFDCSNCKAATPAPNKKDSPTVTTAIPETNDNNSSYVPTATPKASNGGGRSVTAVSTSTNTQDNITSAPSGNTAQTVRLDAGSLLVINVLLAVCLLTQF